MNQKLHFGLSPTRILRISGVICPLGILIGEVIRNLVVVGKITITSRPLNLVTKDITFLKVRVIIVIREMKTGQTGSTYIR